MAAVEVVDLVVRHGSVTAVDGLSFTADAGRVTALLGPNGAGKTTTVETLEGYRRPSAGHTRVLGLDPVTDHRRLVPRIGVMLQKGGVYPGMNSRDALRLFASYYAEPADPAALLEQVGLGGVATTPWRRLSGGEQQRLSLALALIGRPDVVFLDEPTAAVDPEGRILVRSLIDDLRSRGVCVVLTSHELDEVERLADHVVIVDRGHLVAEGSPAELMRAAPPDEIRFGAPHGIDTAGLSAAIVAAVVETEPGEYAVSAAGTPARIAAITSWLAERDLPLADLRAGRQRLEDVFLRLTGQGDE